MYEYKLIKATKVYDGDTLIAIVDLGFGMFTKQKLRLANINAPELRGDTLIKARESRDFLKLSIKKALKDNKSVTIKTKRDRKGKYGRYIAEIFIEKQSLNSLMVELGYAVVYK